jgi:hypothetical protein
MFQLRSATAVALLLGSAAFAQPGRHGMGPGGPPPGGFGGPGDFAMVRPEFGMAGKVVTGAPYAAQAVTQFTQTLADGNHIQKTTTASMARDSQGRTRTERSVGAIGPLAGSGSAAKAVFINDPVAGMSYMLDASSHTARQIPAMGKRLHQTTDPGAQVKSESAGAVVKRRAMANVKTDDLGTQVIDGLAVQGKRITRTVLAVQAGSDRDIDVVTETWTSPELQMVVMSKTSDPRFGDSVYKLTNIIRAEPDPALFTVPSDYQVQQRPGASAQ